MYIYHALINTLSTHMIHINLNTIFCTHIEHSPAKTTLTHMIHINLNTIFYTHIEHSPAKTTLTKDHMERQMTPSHTRTHTHTRTTVNLNLYDTDLYHASYLLTLFLLVLAKMHCELCIFLHLLTLDSVVYTCTCVDLICLILFCRLHVCQNLDEFSKFWKYIFFVIFVKFALNAACGRVGGVFCPLWKHQLSILQFSLLMLSPFWALLKTATMKTERWKRRKKEKNDIVFR